MSLVPLLSLAGNKQVSVSFESRAGSFLADYCISCHGEEKQKGDITLNDIGMDFGSREEGQRWMAVLDQLETGEMPPKKKKQPGHVARMEIIAAIKEQFLRVGIQSSSCDRRQSMGTMWTTKNSSAESTRGRRFPVRGFGGLVLSSMAKAALLVCRKKRVLRTTPICGVWISRRSNFFWSRPVGWLRSR